jgi:hypothetical protein
MSDKKFDDLFRAVEDARSFFDTWSIETFENGEMAADLYQLEQALDVAYLKYAERFLP